MAKILFRFWAVPQSGTRDKISKSQGIVLENKKARGSAQNQWAALCAAPRSLTVVPKGRFELPRVAPHGPKPGASASSATSAKKDNQ